MVKSRYALILLSLMVLGQISASGDEELPPCCGDGTKKADKDRQSERDPQGPEASNRAHAAKAPPPCGCPIARIAYVGSGLWLFQAEYYENSCEDYPIAFEMYGPYDLPLSPGCDTNCEGARLREQKPACILPEYFKGLSHYVAHDAEERLYPPYDGDHARILVDPKIPYVKFKLDSDRNRERYAKVFVYDLDVKHALDKPEASRHVIYLAKEVATAPDEDTTLVEVTPEPLQSDEVTGGEECHVFRVTSDVHRPDLQMLLLTVE